jgi:uncharacterized protein YjcR
MAGKAKKYFDEQGSLYIRPYRVKDLAAIYGVCTRTVRKWMEREGVSEGKKTCKYFSIPQVQLILGKLGFPQMLHPPSKNR